LESHTFQRSSFEGHNQLTEIGPIHLEQDFQLFRGEKDRGWLLLFTFMIIMVLLGFLFFIIFLFLLPNSFGWNFLLLGGFFHHGLLDWLTGLIWCHRDFPINESNSTRALIPSDALLTPWRTQTWIPNKKQRKGKESRHTPWFTALWRGRGACWSSRMGLGRFDKLYLFTRACTKPTQSD
jgi:hypothetical protein